MDRRRASTYGGQSSNLFKEAITPEILSDVMQHIKSNGDFNEARAKAVVVARGIISRLSTTDKLKVKWPEAWTLLEPLVAEFEAVAAQRAAKNLPAIAQADLNAMFDLPVEVAA